MFALLDWYRKDRNAAIVSSMTLLCVQSRISHSLCYGICIFASKSGTLTLPTEIYGDEYIISRLNLSTRRDKFRGIYIVEQSETLYYATIGNPEFKGASAPDWYLVCSFYFARLKGIEHCRSLCEHPNRNDVRSLLLLNG